MNLWFSVVVVVAIRNPTDRKVQRWDLVVALKSKSSLKSRQVNSESSPGQIPSPAISVSSLFKLK